MLKLFKDVFKVKSVPKVEAKEAVEVKEETKEEAKPEEEEVKPKKEEVKPEEEEAKAVEKTRLVAQIGLNLFLYTTRVEEPFCMTFEVANMLPLCFDFKLIFAGSENIEVFNDRDTCQDLPLAARLTPFSIKTLGCIKKIDPLLEKVIEIGMSLEPVDEDLVKTKAAATKQMSLVAAEVAKQAADPNGDHEYFIDTDFPPCSGSLYHNNRPLELLVPQAVPEGESEAADDFPDEIIVWARAKHIMKGDPEVFVGGIEPADICQGSLGDCWFLCSLACLGEFPEYVENLFLEDSRTANEKGRYEVRLCHYGVWETVVVDDFFPCYPNGGPVYARGHNNELWVLLLEKAYAKMCGNYATLAGGHTYEAMIDLTGAPYREISLISVENFEMMVDNSMWELLLNYDAMGYLQSAVTVGEDTMTVGGDRDAEEGSSGLVGGHAYAILRVKETKCGVRLLEMRNPWGHGGMEWTRDWSDTSPLWTEELKIEMDARIKEGDGAFWITFDDFTDFFTHVNVCMVRQPETEPHGNARKPWEESRERFKFTMEEGVDGKEVTAPAFLLTLTERSEHVYVGIHQQATRCVDASEYIDVGITVLKIDNSSPTGYILLECTDNRSARQNQTDVMSLDAGQYYIVPTTTGTMLRQRPDQTAVASVVVHTCKPHTLVEKAFNAELYEDAVELPIMKYGKVKVLEPGITLHTRMWTNGTGVSYVIKNDHDRPMRFTQDFSAGKNLLTHREAPKYERTIMPGHAKVLHHVTITEGSESWQVSWRSSHTWL